MITTRIKKNKTLEPFINSTYLLNDRVFRREKKIPDWLHVYKTLCSEICSALHLDSVVVTNSGQLLHGTQGTGYRSPSLRCVKGTDKTCK